jgi:hypothetical protein
LVKDKFMTSISCYRLAVLLTGCFLLVACGADPDSTGTVVETSGKEATALQQVPPEVLQVARTARPDLVLESAEHEVRNGRQYYDLEGKMPDGSELELDMTMVDGRWTVVEVQRDISMESVADGARDALFEANPGWEPSRIIESDQGDGVVIYEFFGTGPRGEETKVEVKWEDNTAELLRDEWVH